MLYPINIYVFENGNKLDVNQEETIEINMGGISLLNLQQRTYTHTNSFSLPRTPNNEKELGYIGLKQVYATPSIDVIIQRGLINLRGFITVLNTTESTIEVSFVYDDGGGFAALKNMNFYTMVYNDYPYPYYENSHDGRKQMLTKLTSLKIGVNEAIHYAPHNIAGIPAFDYEGGGGLLIHFNKLLEILQLELGIEFQGMTELPSQVWIMNRCGGFGLEANKLGELKPFVSRRSNYVDEFLSVSEVIKAVCQLYNLDFVQTSYNTFEFKSFTTILANDPYVIDQDILEWQKRTNTGMALNNRILYKNKSTLATLIGNGTGDKEMFVSSIERPIFNNRADLEDNSKYWSGYDLDNTEEVVILENAVYKETKKVSFFTGIIRSDGTINPHRCVYEINVPRISPATGGSYYYIIRNALRYPIIFDITIWLSNYDFEQVSQKRMVRSVVLGGDFFVEKMAYNVNTGNAVLTLIKKW